MNGRHLIKNEDGAQIGSRQFTLQNYKAIFDLCPNAIFVAEENGHFIAVNYAGEMISGYGREELVGMHFTQLVPAAERAANEKRFDESFESFSQQGKVEKRFETVMLRKDGQCRQIQLTGSPLMSDEKAIGMLAIIEDITERNKAEKEIRQSQARYQMLLESSNDALFVHFPTPDALPGKFVEVNSVTCRLLGYTREELLTLSPADILAKNEKSHLSDLLKKAFREKSIIFETDLVTKDGRPFPVEISSHLFDYEGRTVIVANARDITERRKAEEQLELAKRRAEEANEAKSQFMANMSHEIRTPITVFMGLIDLMDTGTLSEGMAANMTSLRQAGKSLMRIANDILDVTRIETGRLSVERTACSIPEMVTCVESMVQPLSQKRDFEFCVMCDSDVPATIVTDYDRLLQCLLNLLNNAFKFTVRGHVHLNVSARSHGETPSICFDVEDTGIGIPKESLETIFELFTQVDVGKTRQYEGAGLGLAITKRITELLGGRLRATSQTGVGSKFSLTLPIGDSATNPVQKVVETNPSEFNQMKGSVLLVEDYAGIRKILARQLNQFGLDVGLAENGQQGVEMALVQSFDLILMDVQMPVMDGLAATRKLREQGIETPIVALTAYAAEDDRRECLDAGCSDYLSKPIDRDELKRVLAEYAAQGE